MNALSKSLVILVLVVAVVALNIPISVQADVPDTWNKTDGINEITPALTKDTAAFHDDDASDFIHEIQWGEIPSLNESEWRTQADSNVNGTIEVAEALNWVCTNIGNVTDQDNYMVSDAWANPEQTLKKGSGDAEDKAFLLASLLKWHTGAVNTTEGDLVYALCGFTLPPEEGFHAWVFWYDASEHDWHQLDPTNCYTNHILDPPAMGTLWLSDEHVFGVLCGYYPGPLHPVAIEGVLSASDFELVAKAAPDECYAGINETYPEGPPCEESVPKTNQAYIWGLTKAGDDVWFGTIANTLCLVMGMYIGATDPHQTDSWVCEFGNSQLCQPPFSLPDELGDWRPPQIYTYNTTTGVLEDKTPPIANPTIGWRSAITHQGIVFLGGPSLMGGINLVAFSAETGEFLGWTTLPAYNDVRRWVSASDGNLYLGVGKFFGGGAVLKWIGDPEGPLFAFEEVGLLDASAAEITEYNGKLWVATWPIGAPFSIYRSPGLDLEDIDALLWEKVWNITQYDPDIINQQTTGGGAIHAYNGWLYFGTMHVPGLAAMAAMGVGDGDAADAMLGSHRATSIFRLNETVTDIEVELLFGEKMLPAFNFTEKRYDFNFQLTGYTPTVGHSGFWNPSNNYTWAMVEHNGVLYVGTMDWSYLAKSMVRTLFSELCPDPEDCLPDLGYSGPGFGSLATEFSKQYSNPAGCLPDLGYSGPGFDSLATEFSEQYSDPAGYLPDLGCSGTGFDLWATDGDLWMPVSLDGLGNFLNYGDRNMISDGTSMFIGTANPMNLEPEGGWELWQASPPEGESTNAVGVGKDTYTTAETVYATGSGFPASSYVDVYIVEDLAWTNGMAIPPDVSSDGMNTVPTDAAGNLATTNVWPPPLTPGAYDIVFDADQDGVYDAVGDYVDHPGHPGFVARAVEPPPPLVTGVPTLSQWGMIAMGILFAAFLIWTVRRRWAVSAGGSQE